MQDAKAFETFEYWTSIESWTVEELLLLGCFAFEIREGRRPEAILNLRRQLWLRARETYDPGKVLNSVVAEGLQGKNPLWRDHYVMTGRKLAADLWGTPDSERPANNQIPPMPFVVKFRRTFNLEMAKPGERTRLRLPMPIEDEHLTDLEIVVAPSVADVRMNSGRLEAKLDASRIETFTLEAKYSFTAHFGRPHGINEPGADLVQWLKAKEGSIQVTEQVRMLAEQLDDERVSAFERVMVFRDHVIDTMICGMLHSECVAAPETVDWVLANRWFDCRIGSALLVALCRAKGIPARLIGGYLLWAAPTEHYWIEAWLPDRGWTPFDLLAWDLSAGGQDKDWRNVYAGAVDYRMKTQIFPDLFTGAPGVTMSAPWHRLARAIPQGVETRFVAVPDGKLLYADEITVFKG